MLADWNGYGQLQLELSEMASRLSPVKPLGSYNMAFDLTRRKCRSASEYLKGPMMLAEQRCQWQAFQFSESLGRRRAAGKIGKFY
jgi:hypothetical protein